MIRGIGSHFPHSTGQAYKGRPNTGMFLQITCDDANDIQVPNRSYTLGQVKAADALGDFEMLAGRGKRLSRIHISGPSDAGLLTLTETTGSAMNME